MWAICSGTDHRLGATAGAGIEYGITPAISAKFEYLYITAVSLDVSHINEVTSGSELPLRRQLIRKSVQYLPGVSACRQFCDIVVFRPRSCGLACRKLLKSIPAERII
jgi:hypothetical protein